MANQQEILENFLTVWPIERLSTMTIDEYCIGGDEDTYSRWLEFRTDTLGSISGYSTKFGVFRRRSPKDEPPDSAYATDGVYSWVKHYGNSAQSVFMNIRSRLVEIAQAARNSDINSIGDSDLPPLLKWKTAFMYQNFSSPIVVPVFSEKMLKYLAFEDVTSKKEATVCHTMLIRNKPPSQDLWDYANSLWEKWSRFNTSVSGLIASDKDPWKDEMVEILKQHDTAVVWWSKRPSGGKSVIDQLRQKLTEDESFYFYYTSGGKVSHRARVIDIAFKNDYVNVKDRWSSAEWFQEDFSNYSDAASSQSAKIAFLIDDMEVLDGSLSPSDFSYWNNMTIPRQDNLQPFTKLNVMPSTTTASQLINKHINSAPHNIIFYGPPGTGKTFYFQQVLMERFTARGEIRNRTLWLIDYAAGLSWWKIVAAVLLENGPMSVPNIFTHEFVKAKLETTAQASPKAMLWAMLQQHADINCVNVKYQRRVDPLLFWKDENSVWSVNKDMAAEAIPEVLEFVDLAKNFAVTEPINEKHWEFITFHQSMSYEDFIEGIKPRLKEESEDSGLAYHIQDGIFKQICKRARHDPKHDYALFIDEINRGNVAAIFGELISLIEEDKREGSEHVLSAILPYSRESFSVPKNLFIYGTMNSADRSVEALDTALRRRFSFKEIEPNVSVITPTMVEGVDLPKLLEAINLRIEVLKDRDHRIGHAYFMNLKTLDGLRSVFTDQILPLLQEYFYGDWSKIALVLGQTFVVKSGSTAVWPKGFESEGEDSAREIWVITDPTSWTEHTYTAVYGA